MSYLQETRKIWNEVLNPCKYFKHHNCTKPFATGNRRWWDCKAPKSCCLECDREVCATRCKGSKNS